MKTLRTAPSILILGVFAAASASAQYSVHTTASAAAGAAGSGTVSYNGSSAGVVITQGQGTVTYANAPNTANLTQATSQLKVTSGSTTVSAAYATANLGWGTLGALGSGTPSSNSGSANVFMNDTLTFHVPGATSSTITPIVISFQVSGDVSSLGSSFSFLRSTTLALGNATISEAYNSGSATPGHITQNQGWTSMQIVSL